MLKIGSIRHSVLNCLRMIRGSAKLNNYFNRLISLSQPDFIAIHCRYQNLHLQEIYAELTIFQAPPGLNCQAGDCFHRVALLPGL